MSFRVDKVGFDAHTKAYTEPGNDNTQRSNWSWVKKTTQKQGGKNIVQLLSKTPDNC